MTFLTTNGQSCAMLVASSSCSVLCSYSMWSSLIWLLQCGLYLNNALSSPQTLSYHMYYIITVTHETWNVFALVQAWERRQDSTPSTSESQIGAIAELTHGDRPSCKQGKKTRNTVRRPKLLLCQQTLLPCSLVPGEASGLLHVSFFLLRRLQFGEINEYWSYLWKYGTSGKHLPHLQPSNR